MYTRWLASWTWLCLQNDLAIALPYREPVRLATGSTIQSPRFHLLYHWWTALIKLRLLFFPCRLCFLRTYFFSYKLNKVLHQFGLNVWQKKYLWVYYYFCCADVPVRRIMHYVSDFKKSYKLFIDLAMFAFFHK